MAGGGWAWVAGRRPARFSLPRRARYARPASPSTHSFELPAASGSCLVPNGPGHALSSERHPARRERGRGFAPSGFTPCPLASAATCAPMPDGSGGRKTGATAPATCTPADSGTPLRIGGVREMSPTSPAPHEPPAAGRTPVSADPAATPRACPRWSFRAPGSGCFAAPGSSGSSGCARARSLVASTRAASRLPRRLASVSGVGRGTRSRDGRPRATRRSTSCAILEAPGVPPAASLDACERRGWRVRGSFRPDRAGRHRHLRCDGRSHDLERDGGARRRRSARDTPPARARGRLARARIRRREHRLADRRSRASPRRRRCGDRVRRSAAACGRIRALAGGSGRFDGREACLPGCAGADRGCRTGKPDRVAGPGRRPAQLKEWI